MSYSLFLFNYQFYLVLDDNRGMIIVNNTDPLSLYLFTLSWIATRA